MFPTLRHVLFFINASLHGCPALKIMHLMSHAALGLDVARHHQARLLAGLAEHELDLEHKVIKCPDDFATCLLLPRFIKMSTK